MNPTPPKSLQVSTPDDLTIVLTRAFNAPRRFVWESMTTPENMRRWTMLPPGWTLLTCECDARVGGALRLVSRSEEADPAMTLLGVFTEVAPFERLVHTEAMLSGTGALMGTLVETHEFTESRGLTTLRITQTYPSKNARDGAIASGMDEGMEACYCRLDSLLARPA